MPPWDWKDYDDTKVKLGVLKAIVEQCNSTTPKQVLRVRESIDYLFEHSDQDDDDMTRDKDLSKELEDIIDQFTRSCSCKNK